MTKYKDKEFNKSISRKKKRNINRIDIREKEGIRNGEELIRLNKYISNSGVCSRRDADKLIESGVVKVNGKIVTELGTKIKPDDKVEYGSQRIKNERHVYLLLNKPKDYITTMDDPQGRRTVMELVGRACKERIYPVGRLDRNTTGLLLFTNDGELVKKLTHPRYNVRKIYNVLLDKKLLAEDLLKIKEGINIDGENIIIDDISFVEEGQGRREVGIELHSGQNRIVRRIFESLGYEVVKLDRIFFAGLTKKNLQRGKWRFLTQSEIAFLKMGRFR